MRQRNFLIILSFFLVTLGCSGKSGNQEKSPGFLQVSGLQTPESIFWDASRDHYYISNINGSATEKDGNGFISRFNPSDSTFVLKWIDGSLSGTELNGPKGIAVVKDRLFVTDIDAIRVFTLPEGGYEQSIQIPGAKFLNDIVAVDDNLYVSDSFTNSIYLINYKMNATLFVRDDRFQRPNGLVKMDQTRIAVVSFNGKQMMSISLDGEVTPLTQFPGGGLDGIVKIPGGQYLVSSWENRQSSAFMRVKFRKRFLPGCNLLLTLDMMENETVC